jgi:hypothetical protein
VMGAIADGIEANSPKRPRLQAPPAHTPGEMNKTEAEYARHLGMLVIAGEIRAYWFERLTIIMSRSPRSTYTPDFIVWAPGGVEVHEVKGFMREDAREKLLHARTCCPWVSVWYIVRREGGGWAKQRIEPVDTPTVAPERLLADAGATLTTEEAAE